MKRIQKGFTLIELMIVVAIIGILAAVAIPAYQDYIVKAKLSKVVSTLDPIKTALAMYYQEQGGFPLGPDTNDVTTNVGVAPAIGTVWNSLGFSTYPSLPAEVSEIAYEALVTAPATTASSFALILTLTNIKATVVDGMWVSISPTQGKAPTSQTSAGMAATDIVTGSSAINWYYGCNKGATTAADAVVKRFFNNAGTTLNC